MNGKEQQKVDIYTAYKRKLVQREEDLETEKRRLIAMLWILFIKSVLT